MAQDKDERATATGSPRKAPETEDKKASSDRGAPRPNGNSGIGPGIQASRRQQYLIALRRLGPPMTGTPPQSIDAVVDYLSRQDGFEVVGRVKSAAIQPFAFDGASAREHEIVVGRMAEAKAESLRDAAQAQIIVERDGPLSLADGLPLPMRASGGASSVLPLSSVVGELSLRIVGERDQPLAHASVVVYGPGFPIQAVTDEAGIARLNLFGGGAELVQAIYVKPKTNYWERFITAPELNESNAPTIRLRPLAETAANPASERVVHWGQRLMHLDQPGSLTGAGIRVAIIDSGCDNTHPALRHVVHGKDFTKGRQAGQQGSEGRRSDTGWTDDVLGYGTHSAGLIAAAPGAGQGAGQGIAGCAPEAEVHAFKVSPGGRLSDLLAALDECIAREIDVVCLSVGCDEGSALLDQKIHELRHKGIACIVAAGTSSGPLQFPAVLPAVLAVGAVGKLREFPTDTCHAHAIMPESIGNGGLFPAAFTGVGPHVAVSAPGVAVLSSVPGGYAALDGTGIAAAQVTGMAALILAHHPLFQGPLKARSEQRVSALFSLIRACAVPQFADSLRGGAGVPDLQRVPGLYGTTAPGAHGELFDAGMIGPAGVEPYPYAQGYAQGWHAVMQMRAAGLI
jgi:subtilisin family serine protease